MYMGSIITYYTTVISGTTYDLGALFQPGNSGYTTGYTTVIAGTTYDLGSLFASGNSGYTTGYTTVIGGTYDLGSLFQIYIPIYYTVTSGPAPIYTYLSQTSFSLAFNSIDDGSTTYAGTTISFLTSLLIAVNTGTASPYNSYIIDGGTSKDSTAGNTGADCLLLTTSSGTSGTLITTSTTLEVFLGYPYSPSPSTVEFTTGATSLTITTSSSGTLYSGGIGGDAKDGYGGGGGGGAGPGGAGGKGGDADSTGGGSGGSPGVGNTAGYGENGGYGFSGGGGGGSSGYAGYVLLTFIIPMYTVTSGPTPLYTYLSSTSFSLAFQTGTTEVSFLTSLSLVVNTDTATPYNSYIIDSGYPSDGNIYGANGGDCLLLTTISGTSGTITTSTTLQVSIGYPSSNSNYPSTVEFTNLSGATSPLTITTSSSGTLYSGGGGGQPTSSYAGGGGGGAGPGGPGGSGGNADNTGGGSGGVGGIGNLAGDGEKGKEASSGGGTGGGGSSGYAGYVLLTFVIPTIYYTVVNGPNPVYVYLSSTSFSLAFQTGTTTITFSTSLSLVVNTDTGTPYNSYIIDSGYPAGAGGDCLLLTTDSGTSGTITTSTTLQVSIGYPSSNSNYPSTVEFTNLSGATSPLTITTSSSGTLYSGGEAGQSALYVGGGGGGAGPGGAGGKGGDSTSSSNGSGGSAGIGNLAGDGENGTEGGTGGGGSSGYAGYVLLTFSTT